MGLASIAAGWVRRLVPSDYADAGADGKAAHVNNRGDLLVAQALPPDAEATRMGTRWSAAIPTGSAFTYVNAWPTTRAELIIYNSSLNKTYVFRSAWMFGITSMGASQPITLVAQLSVPGTVAAPSDNSAVLRKSRNGQRAYGGGALCALANTGKSRPAGRLVLPALRARRLAPRSSARHGTNCCSHSVSSNPLTDT